MKMTQTLGQRLKESRAYAAKNLRVAKLSQAKIAEMCGWGTGNQSRIGNYETDYREPSLQEIKQLAAAYGVSFAWLCTGQGNMHVDKNYMSLNQSAAEYMTYPPLRIIPVISWQQATNIPQDPIPVTGTPAYTFKPCNERAFALIQQGNSMEPAAGFGHSVWAPAGCQLIADPDAAHTPGCFTIAQPAGYSEPICRQLITDGGQKILVALNPQFPNIAIAEGCRLIAPVIDIQLNYHI
jgi:SOS-response transcriptional repressor LexA